MWRALSKCLPLALVCSILTNSSYGRVNVPDWVRQAAATKFGTLPPETKAVVLLDQTDYTVTAPGEFLEHSRSVLKILRPDGREYGNPGISFRKSEKIRFLHAWSIDSAGNEYELKDKDFLENEEFSFELYSDFMERSAKAAGLGPGTVVALEFEIKRHEWINELGWQFQSEFPVVESVLSVELPAGWEYHDSWSSGLPVKPMQTGPNRWEWRLQNVPGIADGREPMMPSSFVLAERMSLAYFAPGITAPTSASWAQVGKWYSELVGARPASNPEIAAKVAELIAGKTDFDSKLASITRFLQSEIRYVAIEIGIGGDQPHPASDVFHFRYGDCKDKVTLLKAMLQVAGIQSYYVLIDTHRGFINPAVPSSWGNHAIIAIELRDDVKTGDYQSVVTVKSGKRYIIFDPTDEYTPVGSLRSELQSSYGLIVTDSAGELIRTPLLPPDSNVVSRTGRFTLLADGSLSGEVSEEQSGDFASYQRGMLHGIDQRERDRLISQALGRSIQGFSLDNIQFQQTDQLQKSLLMSFRITTPLYGQPRGPMMLVRPRVLNDESYPVEHKPRHYPIELRRTGRQIDIYEIELPKGYSVDDVPGPVKIDVGFASYQSKVEARGNKLHYWREYVVRDLSVPPEKYADWVRLEGTIGADEAAVAVLKRTQ
jgi:hypothetical protein